MMQFDVKVFFKGGELISCHVIVDLCFYSVVFITISSVRENVCNNSKNVKSDVFLDFEKNVKTYVEFQRPLNHSGL